MEKFKNGPFIQYIKSSSLPELYNVLADDECRVFELDGNVINDAESFFASIITILPLDPPLSGKVRWEAFSDSLWYGMDGLAKTSPHVAILWKNAENMMQHDFTAFQTAIACLEDVASTVATDEYGIEMPVKLRVFLLGQGTIFSPINIE